MITLFIVSIISCSRKQTIENETKYLDEFYSVLNEIARNKYPEVSLIVNETKPVFRTYYGSYPVPKPSKEIPPPPPPLGIVCYNHNTFMFLKERKQIDSANAEFMLYSIDSTKTFLLDSTKTNLHLIPKSKIIEVYKFYRDNFKEKHIEFKNFFGSKCFLEVATPIFNSNYTKVIFTLECKGDTIIEEPYNLYVYEKTGGKWKQINGEEIIETR